MQESKIGCLIKEWRTARCLSINQLAKQAGIGSATLSRWEAGAAQPRLPELEAVLGILRVSTVQKRQALAQMKTQRAMRRLHQDITGLGGSSQIVPPSAGGLLRALRHRRG